MRHTVLVASPDAESRCDFASVFSSAEYNVLYGTRTSELTWLIKEHRPALILLSEDMTCADGLDIVPSLRRLTLVPLIVMGDGGSAALIKYVLNGADVYMNGPVSVHELSARARNLLNRARSGERSSSKGKDSPSADELSSKINTSLTQTEMRLFKCLAQQRGRLVSTDEINDELWGKPVKSSLLRFYVHSLRRKLSRYAPFKLHTQKGVGYRLIETDEDTEGDSGV